MFPCLENYRETLDPTPAAVVKLEVQYSTTTRAGREPPRSRIPNMAIDKATFELISPSRFLTFSFPNPDLDPLRLGDDLLRIAVLDSSRPLDTDPPRVAALLVPKGREHDWIFSSSYGHLQLLATSPAVSRLILVGNPPRPDLRNATYTRPILSDDGSRAQFEKMLVPLLLALSPKSAFRNGIPEIPFLVYEDNIFRSVSVEVCNGSVVGEMLVEDVEIEETTTGDGEESIGCRELRRRLRFKRMPNLIQTQMRIISADGEFLPDTRVLVQPYLPPMVASLSLIAPYLEECIRTGLRPRVLCVGIGGGALLSFLRAHLGFFDILGVEMDETVLQVASRYFGLVEDEFLRVCVGDGVELIQKFARRAIRWNSMYDKFSHHSSRCPDNNNLGVGFVSIENLNITCNSGAGRSDATDFADRQGVDFRVSERMGQCSANFRDQVGNGSSFSCDLVPDDFEINKGVRRGRWVDDRDSLVDVIMIDLDSSDATNVQSAPPLEFVQKSVLLAVRSTLHGRGICALNVIISRSDSFYVSFVTALREVFSELYAIDVGNGENHVLVATVSPVGFVASDNKSPILEKLKGIIDGVYIDRLRKI